MVLFSLCYGGKHAEFGWSCSVEPSVSLMSKMSLLSFLVKQKDGEYSFRKFEFYLSSRN